MRYVNGVSRRTYINFFFFRVAVEHLPATQSSLPASQLLETSVQGSDADGFNTPIETMAEEDNADDAMDISSPVAPPDGPESFHADGTREAPGESIDHEIPGKEEEEEEEEEEEAHVPVDESVSERIDGSSGKCGFPYLLY